jgi:hypothetical protein
MDDDCRTKTTVEAFLNVKRMLKLKKAATLEIYLTLQYKHAYQTTWFDVVLAGYLLQMAALNLQKIFSHHAQETA